MITSLRSSAEEASSRPGIRPLTALRSHWPEYLIEAALLAVFMISACAFAVLLEHPSSPVHQSIDDAAARRLLMGVAMGCTLVGIVYSPWGQRSGAHINPGVTLTFLMLGKIDRWDAIFYAASQFAGGLAGVMIARVAIGAPLGHEAVNYAATIPGRGGALTAFWAEMLISLLMMSSILIVANVKSLNRLTGLFAAVLLASFITLEAPLSGTSLNPARTVASALPASEWTAIWLYFVSPPLAMLLAGLFYRLTRGRRSVFCAKLHHHNRQRCIFRCNYGALNVNQ